MPRALVLRHHQEDRPGLVGEALESRGFQLDVVLMVEEGDTPSAAGYDLLLILGSKHAVYDVQIEAAWFGRELDVIAEADRLGVPIFGICFGAQALCRFHGGVVSPSSDPEIGWFEVDEQNDSGIARGPWFEYHYDECTLPDEASLWATTPRSVQAFSVGRNVGVQFHPEVDDLQLAEWFAADDDDDEAREVGAMHAALVAQTKVETPAARLRAMELVDLVLGHFSTWADSAP